MASDSAYINDPQYRHMVRQLLDYVPSSFNFASFRKIYSQTSYYEPIGTQAVEDLLSAAYAVQMADDDVKAQKALVIYEDILKAHMANIMVVRQAYALARQDSRLGNPEILLNIYDGMRYQILNGGNGRKLSSAYGAVTLAEEVFILGQLGYRIEETVYNELGPTKYNMHFVKEPAPEDPISIFINLSIPMHEIEKRKINSPAAQDDLRFKG